MQSIDSIETYAYGMNKVLIPKKEEIKCNNVIKQYKNVYITKEDIKEHDPNWPEIPDHTYGILIIGGSGSGKTNSLLCLTNHEPNINKNFFIC